MIEIFMRHAQDAPPPLSMPELPPQMVMQLDRIIGRCMAKDPQQRYQSATQLQQDLNSLATSVR